MSGRQNITTFQLPPAKGSELKPHPYLLCSDWKQMEKRSHAGIQKTKNPKPNKTPPKQTTTTKNPLNVSQGFSEGKILHFKNWAQMPACGLFGPLLTFPKFDSVRGFLRNLGVQNQGLVQVHPDQVPPMCFMLTVRAWITLLCNNPAVRMWLKLISISYI